MSTEFKEKRNKLLKASKKLKKEFIGLNTIIDELINNIEPWYLMSEEQIRPTVINLWGMTGVGKTSLVRRLFEILELNELLYRFDVGKYASSSGTDLTYELSEDLENISNKPCAFIFDEFQLSRTISSAGEEIDRNNLRIIWDILDSGIVEVIDTSWQSKSLATLIFKLEYCFKNGMRIDNGKIIGGKKLFENVFSDDFNSSEELFAPSKKDKKNKKDEAKIEYITDSYLNIIKDCSKNKWFSKKQVAEELISLSSEELLKELERIFKKAFSIKECNFNKAIIFVIGNLDEAYQIQSVINPDIDADFFNEFSSKITITDIKESLQNRFRSEQIARLGNTHLIYPSFSSQDYRDIIKSELNKIKIKKYDITFTKNIQDLLYKESVFPTQGVRPILTTINSIIRTYIPRIIISASEEGLSNKQKLIWDYDISNSKYIITLDKKTFSYKVNSRMETLRKSIGDETQLITAVHESGHAIVSSLIAGLIPEYVYSKTASSAEGFCYTKEPDIKNKKYFKKQLSVLLAGLVAEEIVFNTITVGSSSDLQKASSIALKIVKEYGMGKLKASIGFPGVENEINKISTSHKKYEKEAEKLIKKAHKKAKKCLLENKELLIKMSDFLSNNSKLEKKLINELLISHSNWEVPQKIDYIKSFEIFKNA